MTALPLVLLQPAFFSRLHILENEFVTLPKYCSFKNIKV